MLISHALCATAVSMPWPALLAQVWSMTGSDAWLGAAGAARMLPYVVLSAAAGVLADRVSRTRVLRWSTAGRAVLLAGCAVALATDQLGLALVLAVLTVAVGTPAYPAAVAALPTLMRSAPSGQLRQVTNLLVTAEVTGFVVGPALGGVLLGFGRGEWGLWVAAGLATSAFPWLIGLRAGRANTMGAEAQRGRLRTVLDAPGVRLAIAMVALVNLTESIASIALLNLSHQAWGSGDRGFGVATAALGFGSLAAPLLGLVVRLRGSLLITGGGFAVVGLAPGVAVAVGPLAVAGAAGTVVECVSTEVLQRSVPDRVRAFSLGLADSVMVLAAMLGALIAPRLASLIGAPTLFVATGLVLIAVGMSRSRSRTEELPVGQPVTPVPSTTG
ncbi:MAG TPA: MFS transporter [Propionibacteriaceae bacterium]|nr:MFS transporter [Propionibacteriaceae bacterium]